jgi:beta-lactam-binding protein with PASTA domain
MATVFLCYRKEDAGGVVGRVKDRLEDAYTADSVFEYTHDVALAANFRTVIDEALNEVGVVLVAIGPEWLDIETADGARRLDQPDDPVRVEVETAIQRGKPIIPLLFDGALIPPKSALPDSMGSLPDTNGLPIREDPDFDGDVDKLVLAIDRIVGWKRRDRSRRRLGWLALAASVILVPAVILLLTMLLSQEPIVPDVTGLTSAQAARILETVGVDITASSATSEEPADTVIAQEPAGGERGEIVALVISTGPVVLVPNVVGQIATEATAQLAAGGFGVETVELESEQPIGVVVDQLPDPGVESATVLLVVSSGPPPELPEIPDFIGMTRTEALAEVPEGVRLVEELVEDPADEDVVVDQDPRPFEKADEVLIVVSAGPGLPVVPDVVGSSEQQARAELEEAGITVTEVSGAASVQLLGTVLEQTPAKDDRAATVSLVVSTGPGPDQFAGTWVNIDEASSGLTRLVIGSSGTDTATVHAFVACDPSDCDLGQTTGTVAEEMLTAPFGTNWKTTSLIAEFAGDLLLVSMTDRFTLGTGGGTTYHVMTRAGRSITDAVITEALVARPDLTQFLIQQPEFITLVPVEFDPQLLQP